MPATLSAALVIAIVVSLLKPFLEARVSKTSALHDGTIRLVAVLLGVAGSVVQSAIAAPLTPYAAWNAAGTGLLAAVTAIATFHLVTANYFQAQGSEVASTLSLPAAPTPMPATPPAPSAIEQVAAAGFTLPEAK